MNTELSSRAAGTRMTRKNGKSLLAAAWLLLAGGAHGAQGTQEAQDAYIAGYARALLDRQFGVEAASVEVKNGLVTLHVSELHGADRQTLMKTLSAIEGVRRVEITKVAAPAPGKAPEETTLPGSFEIKRDRAGVEEEVAPSLPMLFPLGDLFGDLLADPRNPRFTLGLLEYQGHGHLQTVAATGFGETLGLVRGGTPLGGQWQMGLQASIFSLFDMDSTSNDLLNNDYRLGFPLSYRRGSLSAQLHPYHQSSHLGDEFILRNQIRGADLDGNGAPPPIDGTGSITTSQRVDLSYEGVDLRFSWNVSEWTRVYGGPGYILSHSEQTELETWSGVSGIEFESPWAMCGGRIRPVAAAHVENWEYRDWKPDASLRAGVCIESMRGVGRRALLALSYYQGRDYNGQFLRNEEIEYLGLVLDVYF